MAVVCAECKTANRGDSKFCKGCGRRLSLTFPVPLPIPMSDAAPAARLPNVDDEWPATQRMAYQVDAAAERFDPLVPPLAAAEGIAVRRPRNGSAHPVMASSSSAIPSRTIRRSASLRSPRSPRTADKRPSFARRLGTWSVLIAVVLLVAVGWGYVYNSRNSAVPAVAKEFAAPVPVEPVVPAPVETVASPPAVQMAEPAEPVQLAPALPPVAEAPPAEPVKPIVAAAPKSRKRTPAVAVAAPPTEVPAPEPAPAPSPQPVALATPQSQCAGLNFFARAQCLAAQCAKADYKAHAQCEAVRRQQQIDEEKRNPTLLN